MPQDNTNTTDNNIMNQPNMAQAVGAPGNGMQAGMAQFPIPASADSGLPEMSDVVVMPGAETREPEPVVSKAVSSDIRTEIATKIGEAKNVLIALSGDPSVDELAAAIGLSLYLDKIGKRATAIYSGATPNALEFLKPEETFETSADTLQDFVIAINKDKADHLRYRLDGEYVKIYITPYKHRLSADDLEFSYGDYNVDLVIALDVANGIDLDSALREHGRIMHDASIVNVTTANPGKFGELEWSDKGASSVSEMIAKLLYEFGGDERIAKDEATAFLTGIVAATNRFSNAKTTPETMRVCSRLMESGANQQLVARNVTLDTENEIFNEADGSAEMPSEAAEAEKVVAEDSTKLDVEHEYERNAREEEARKMTAEIEPTMPVAAQVVPGDIDEAAAGNNDNGMSSEVASQAEIPAANAVTQTAASDATSAEVTQTATNDATSAEAEPISKPDEINADITKKEHTLLEDLKVAEEALSHAGQEAVEQSEDEKLRIETPEKVIEPSAGFDANSSTEETDKYGKMLKDALDSVPEPVQPVEAIMSKPDEVENPAAASAPVVPSAPEINGVPEMNFTIPADTEILPPPPAPPAPAFGGMPEDTQSVGASSQAEPIQPATPAPGPSSLGAQPAMQDQVYSAQENDPSAFKIPGM